MNNQINKYLVFDKNIRLYVIEASNLVGEIARRQEASFEASIALGRMAMATVLLGSLSSEDAIVYSRIEGGGPIGVLHADSDANGNVKAYAHYPQATSEGFKGGHLDVASLVGRDGELKVIRDFGLKEMQSASTKLVTSEIAEDFTHFFAASEQIPTAVGLAVFPTDERFYSFGFIAQVLPGCPENTIAMLEEKIANMPDLLSYAENDNVEQMVSDIAGEDFVLLESQPVNFHCNCSKERFIDAFYSLPVEELQEMLETDDDEELICNYCNEKYYIDNREIQTIIDNKTSK